MEAKEGAISFDSRWMSETRIEARVLVNETEFLLVADRKGGEGGTFSIEVPSGKFQKQDLPVMAEFSAVMAEYLPYPEEGSLEEEHAPHETLVRNTISYFTNAPEDIGSEPIVIDFASVIVEEGTGEDDDPDNSDGGEGKFSAPGTVSAQGDCVRGCNCASDNDFVSFLPMCCWGGRTINWQHDALPGSPSGVCGLTTRSNTCGFRAPSCEGRCGVGCWAPPVYVQDCMDHDWCVNVERDGSFIWNSTHCKGEFLEGVDDFVVIWGMAARWLPHPAFLVCGI